MRLVLGATLLALAAAMQCGLAVWRRLSHKARGFDQPGRRALWHGRKSSRRRAVETAETFEEEGGGEEELEADAPAPPNALQSWTI